MVARQHRSGFGSGQGSDDVERLRSEVGQLRALLERVQARVDEIEASDGASGADPDATYVVTTNTATLTNERALAAGAGITLTDGGAGSTLTVDCTVAAVTDEHIQDVVGAFVLDTSSVAWSYNDGAGTLSASVPAEFIQDTVGAFVVGGTGITATYNDGANTLTIATTITQYTDELAQDAVGGALVDSSSIDFTYNDGANTITAAVIDEYIQDLMSTTIVAGTAITATYNEGAGTLTIAANPTIVQVDHVLYEVDYAAEANLSFANGNNTGPGSINYIGANLALLNNPRIANGTGLILPAATSGGTGTTYNTTSLAAANLEFLLSSLPGWDGRYDVLIEVHLSALTLETNGESVQVGLRCPAALPQGGSTHRLRTNGIANNGGTNRSRYTTNATTSNGDTSVAGIDVIAIKVGAGGIGAALIGTYSSGWPASLVPVASFVANTGTIDPFNSADARIVFAMGVTNDASPTTTATIRRMRVRRA